MCGRKCAHHLITSYDRYVNVIMRLLSSTHNSVHTCGCKACMPCNQALQGWGHACSHRLRWHQVHAFARSSQRADLQLQGTRKCKERTVVLLRSDNLNALTKQQLNTLPLTFVAHVVRGLSQRKLFWRGLIALWRRRWRWWLLIWFCIWWWLLFLWRGLLVWRRRAQQG